MPSLIPTFVLTPPMQVKVPQNVQREDHIVGPLTLRQLIICGIGGSIAYGMYVGLSKTYVLVTALIPAIIVTGITLAFAFVRPLDLSFTKWIIRWIEFSLIPRKRPWVKSSGEVSIPSQIKATPSKQKKDSAQEYDAALEKQKKLRELSKFLDTKQKTPNG